MYEIKINGGKNKRRQGVGVVIGDNDGKVVVAMCKKEQIGRELLRWRL
jgi:hypothetical protein